MYRIGEFSYLYQVTVKTLQHYEKKDLFMPSYKDPFTGYRYYSDEQRGEFENILKLKELGFSLDEIKKLKEDLTEDKIEEKIRELETKRQELKGTIKKLESLRGKREYISSIGLTFDTEITCVGQSITLEKRDNKKIDEILKEVSKKLDKLKIPHHTSVVITLEVGYKLEDIDLFVGYKIANSNQYLDKIRKKGTKINLELFGYPTSDYLVALNIKDNSNLASVCGEMIDYANTNNIQILGPFMEIYDEDSISIYAFAHDLNRTDIVEQSREKTRNKRIEEKYIPNENILGTWKIREILPNIKFNPDKIKSTLDTKFKEIEFMENGKTNHDNLSYNGNYLIIENNGLKQYNYIYKFNINDKTYLEIRMNDLMLINKNAKPISYIYEKNDE